jgi:hypothetical protein
MRDHERGRYVRQHRRTVEEALTEWLERIRHSLKPSMVKHWQNYIAYYVVPHIGRRLVQDVDGSVCDALYAKLLAAGRIKARPRASSKPTPVHVRRFSANGRALPCRPYRYAEARCYRVHAADDPLLGKPIAARLKPPNEADRAEYRASPGPGAEDGCQYPPHAAPGLGGLHRVGLGEAERCRGCAPALCASEGSQGLVGRPAPSVLGTCPR